MSNLAGRTIKLFLVDGVPDGMRTAEIMSWTGHVLFAPRASVAALLARPEVKKTGAYLLIGPDPQDADQTMVYVGEGDNVGLRISSHNKDADKEFWEHVCVITSKDLNLTKAHARYLESRLIKIIDREGRASLANKSDPDFDLLPESDLADMDDFVARLQILLPVLGADFVRPTPQVRHSKAVKPTITPLSEGGIDGVQVQKADAGTHPEFRMSAGGLAARAVEVDGQMIILAGSDARSEEAPSLASNVRAYREQLRRAGKLRPAEGTGNLRFNEDVAFTSPSAAAQAVMGTSRNGRTDWINTATNETYAVWQDHQVEKVEAPGGEGTHEQRQ
ncbi:GIY-YIG nuclease family protein [Bradyrhizobium glycinis]|uniref:GIY-YIG nuclease family protein n=1 Tax=Bradyrhizobium glycinis TaxID=2751812 RepID=UPI0018D7E81D|nr:GIY-YIG nuclease family protein [Bradyrhizobium glycinis]MBH5370447.1 GIY-YIG nuclease family protein [Bradyrhizobium glycinis]